MCICRIIFLTGASNNHNDSFPCFLSLSSFCTLHRFRRARSALSCYLPWFVPFPLPSFFPTLSILSALGGMGWRGESPILNVKRAPMYSKFHSWAFPNPWQPCCDHGVQEISDQGRRETPKINKRPGTSVTDTRAYRRGQPSLTHRFKTTFSPVSSQADSTRIDYRSERKHFCVT